VSQRGVVFFRGQDIGLEDQKILGRKLGEVRSISPSQVLCLSSPQLSGNPKESGLHIHPTTETGAEKGDQISVISSERRTLFNRRDLSKLASQGWHSDITFEPVPSDYAILKVHTTPATGGDTIWASAYEAYSRLSPPIAKTLEGLQAYHEAKWFKDAAEAYGHKVRDDVRGNPLNQGDALEAVHPIIRVNPVTGWKGLFVNKEFTKRILGVTKDESDLLLNYLFVRCCRVRLGIGQH
jgi:alpha-ketoglutarate-dependent taurine dioxygenase